MLYGLEQGPVEQKIITDSIRQRRPLPDRIRNAPELRLGLELYYIAFMDLNSCRYLAEVVPGPIPWSDIQGYCEVHGITGEQREDLFYFVQHLDKSYLDWSAKKAKQAAEASKSKAPRTRKR